MMQKKLAQDLRQVVGPRGVVDSSDALITYNADGCVMDRHAPDVVVLPYTTEHVAAAIRLAATANLPIVPRGAGTGLAGGATPMQGGLIISTARMSKIEEKDLANSRALVQPGVINFELSEYVKSDGFQFAPDPSSQKSCTIGGNIANNSGGPHCLKYGVTTNHIQALEMVMHDGSIRWTGDGIADAAGYDLTGLIVGSEGTLCMVTRAWVRLTRLPEAKRVVLALFPEIVSASEVVSAVVAAGYLPTSLEVMDANAIRAVNDAYRLGLPRDAGALLLIEVDGVEDGLDELLEEIMLICKQHGALELRPARTEAEQTQVWSARKNAFGAIGRLSPSYYLVDTVVPRTRLPYMMEQVTRLSKEYAMAMANIFHAGDGNLHPIVLYNPRNTDEIRKAHEIASAVIKLSLEEGGAISGEHGIGIEKRDYMPLMFTEYDLQAMSVVYAAFNPQSRFNPTKIFPTGMDPIQLCNQRQQRIASTQGIHHRDELGGMLESIVGATCVLHGAAASTYSVQGQCPTYAVLPGTLEELSGVMAACHQTGASVVPWGGGTQQNLGLIHTAPEVVVVTRRLTHVVKYEPNDLTIGIGAGVTLAEVQALLATHNQMLPIDAPLPHQATLGGLVATATNGPRRLGYGTLRDLLLGVTVVEVDGTVVHNGGQVVKNVSGYDLVRLFHGSQGTLGVIAVVNLRTLPRPRSEATLLMTFSARQSALALIKDLSDTRLTPVAVEYLDAGAMQHIGHMPAYAVVIRAEGIEAACQRHIRDLQAMAERHNALDVQTFHSNAHYDLWQRINDFPASVELPADESLLRLSVLPARLDTALDHLEECATTHALTLASNARAMSGVIYARVRGSAEGLHSLQHALVDRWQHSQVLSCNSAYKSNLPIWGAAPQSHALMQTIKHAFDPAGKLNPGRYIA